MVAAARLEPIRRVRLSAGEREIRMWYRGGLPEHVIRIRASRDTVRGEVIVFWPVEAVADSACGPAPQVFLRPTLAAKCDTIVQHATVGVCRGRFARRPDWRRVLAALDANGAWSLPDESAMPLIGNTVTVDGYMIGVEMRDGARFRAWEYANPEDDPRPEFRRAAAIGAIARDVLKQLRSSR